MAFTSAVYGGIAGLCPTNVELNGRRIGRTGASSTRSTNLAADLKLQGQSPIIFVCHSVGGIVCKQVSILVS
jgi:hypothetical protein